MSSKLQKLMERGRKILGSKYAIMGGAMTWISESNLVSAMSNAGIFGVLASGAMNGTELSQEIGQTKQKTHNPFGVNLIVMNPKLHDLIDVCGAHKVSHVILAGGLPDKNIIDKIHSYGIQVMAFAPVLSIAKRLFKQGIDCLILEGTESGGHVGPVSTLVLIQSILLSLPEYPIFVAGGICRGEVIAAMMQLGAVGCQLGTVFAVCKESLAHEKFKQSFFRAGGRNAITPVQLDKHFQVAPVRAIANIATEEFMQRQKEILVRIEKGEVNSEEGFLSLEHFWAGALRRAVQEGDVDRGSLMAGQIVEIVKEEKSISEIISTIEIEAEKYLQKCSELN